MAFKLLTALECSTFDCINPPTRFCNCRIPEIFICDNHISSHFTECSSLTHRIEDIRLPKDVIDASLYFVMGMRDKIKNRIKIVCDYLENLNQPEDLFYKKIHQLSEYQVFYKNVIKTLSTNSIMPYKEINMKMRKMKPNECLDYFKDSNFFNPNIDNEETSAETASKNSELVSNGQNLNNSTNLIRISKYQICEDTRIATLENIIKNLQNKNQQLSEIVEQNNAIKEELEINREKISQMTTEILNLQTNMERENNEWNNNSRWRRKRRRRRKRKTCAWQKKTNWSINFNTSSKFSFRDITPTPRKINKISTKDLKFQSIFHWDKLMCFKDNSKILITSYLGEERAKETIELFEIPETIGSQIAMCQIPNEEVFCFGNLFEGNYSGIAFTIKIPYKITMLKRGTPCYKTSVCFFNGFVYAFGGEYNSQPLALAERYFFNEKRWDKIKNLPVPLSECSTVAVAKRIYIASNSHRSIYQFNPKGKSYIELVLLQENSTKFLLSRNIKLYIFEERKVLTWNKDKEEWAPRAIDYDLTSPISYKIIYDRSVYFICKNGMSYKFNHKCGLSQFTSFTL